MHSLDVFLYLAGLPLVIICAAAPLAGFILGVLIRRSFVVQGLVWMTCYYIVAGTLLVFWLPLVLPGAFVVCVLLVRLALMPEKRPPEEQRPYCKGCRYDLTGNVSGVCPECGRPIEKEVLTRSGIR